MTIDVLNGFSHAKIRNLHLYKQAVATLASCLLSMTGGLTFGHTAVLLPKLEADDGFPYDKEYDSWIASISPLAMMFGSIGSGPLSDAIGRKRGQMLLIFPFTLGWIVMGIAKNNSTMLAGRFLIGICTGAIRPLAMVYIGEVSDPKYRSMTLCSPSLALFVGGLISHLVGYYYPWRAVCFGFAVPNLICFFILLFLKESPLWLLAKGHTEVGTESFKWFRGDGESAKKELQTIFDSQNKGSESPFKEFTNFVLTKAFIKSIGSMLFVFIAVQLGGINTIQFYAQDIFKNTFGGEVDAFMLMVVTDAIKVVCTGVIMCLLMKRVPRKLTFVLSCFGTTLVLIGLVIYLCIKPADLVWVAVTCIIAYIAIASALTTLSWSFVAEIFPSKVRGFGSGLSSLMSFILLFTSVKVTPSIMLKYGDAAMYGCFGTVTLVAGVVLIFILPETHGKSLQDIENTLYSKKTAKCESDSRTEGSIQACSFENSASIRESSLKEPNIALAKR